MSEGVTAPVPQITQLQRQPPVILAHLRNQGSILRQSVDIQCFI